MDSINYTLNEEQKMMQEQARKFAMAEIRPAELALDKIPDSEETFKSDIYKEIKKRVYQMGYHKLRVPEKFGGLGLGSLSTQIVTEELAVGGVGLAHSILPLGVTAMVVCMLGNMPGAQELIERFVLPFTNDTEGKISGCIAFTEPDYGSDLLTGSGTITTTARKDGGDWIINGAKAQWISNGTSATDIMAIVKIASGDNAGNSAIFVIPSDTKGVSKGKPADKIGERAKNQTEIFFDDVRVPERYKIDIGFDGLFKENFLCMGNTNVGTCMLGLVRAAYDRSGQARRLGGFCEMPLLESSHLVCCGLADHNIQDRA